MLLILSASLIGIKELTAQKSFFQPRFYTLKDDSALNETFIYPLTGWNENDRWMPGVYLTNQLIYEKQIHYQLMPMYSIKTKSFSGAGKIAFNQHFQNSFINNISLFIQGKSFHLPSYENKQMRYYQFETGIKTTFKNATDNANINQFLEIKYHQNGTEEIIWTNNGSTYIPSPHHKILNAVRAKWQYEKTDSIQPFVASVNVNAWKNYARIYANYEYDYNYEPKRWFTFRAFAGIYLFHDSAFMQKYDARLSPNMPGWKTDVFYDGWFLGRNVNEPVYRMQGLYGPGNLYSISPVGQSWNWTLSASGSVSMPFDLPLRLYVAAGISPNSLNANKPFGIFEGGILITTPHKYFEIAFPLVHDKSSKNALLLNTDKYWQRIRFIINFDRINPHTWLKNPQCRK